MHRYTRTALLTLALLCTPAAALADAGTPLILLGIFHLVFLNALIGLFEGVLLSWLFRMDRRRAVGWMIAANYFSLVAGWAILVALAEPLQHHLPGRAPIFRAPLLLVLMVAASWLLSVVLEWPFVAWAMRGTGRKAGTTLWASAVAQSASYMLLIPLYLLASPTSMLRKADLQRDLAFVKPPIATVYYIDAAKGDVWKIGTDGSGWNKVLTLDRFDVNTRLTTRAAGSAGMVDLCRVDSSNAYPRPAPGFLGLRVKGKPGVVVSRSDGDEETWFNFGPVGDEQAAELGGYHLRLGFWPAEGITVYRNDVTVYNLACETPFASWICRNATILPSRQAVFQLGYGADSQIMILDLPTRKLGLLAMGQGPVAVTGASR